MLLAQKVKPQAMRKEPVSRKEQHFKFRSIEQCSPVARQQFARVDPQSEETPVDSESTLSKYVCQNFGVELSIDPNDKNKKMPAPKPSGRGSSFSRRGNTKFLLLYNIIMYNKILWEQAKQFIEKIKHVLRKTVNKHMIKGSCSTFKAKFLPKIDLFSIIPHFYIIWKKLKNLW